MNFIDLLFLVPIVYFSYKGFRNGLIIEVFTLLAFLVGIYAGINFSDGTASLMRENWGFTSEYLPTISFTITVLAVGAMVYFGGKFLEKVVDISGLSIANKMGGVALGFLKSLYLLSILAILIESYDEKNDFISEEKKSESFLFEPVKELSIRTIPHMKESSIFLRNALQPQADSTGLWIDDVIRAKQTADSLGITLEDAKQFKQFHDSIQTQ